MSWLSKLKQKFGRSRKGASSSKAKKGPAPVAKPSSTVAPPAAPAKPAWTSAKPSVAGRGRAMLGTHSPPPVADPHLRGPGDADGYSMAPTPANPYVTALGDGGPSGYSVAPPAAHAYEDQLRSDDEYDDSLEESEDESEEAPAPSGGYSVAPSSPEPYLYSVQGGGDDFEDSMEESEDEDEYDDSSEEVAEPVAPYATFQPSLSDSSSYTSSLPGLSGGPAPAPLSNSSSYTSSVPGLGGGQPANSYTSFVPGLGAAAPAPAKKEKQPLKTPEAREAFSSKILKAKTHDSEGGDLSFAGKDSNFGGEDGSPLAGKQRVAHYEGEDTKLAWRAAPRETMAQKWGLDQDSPQFKARYAAFQNSDGMTTDYHTTPEQREQSRLKEKRGGKVEATHQRRNDLTHGPSEEKMMGWVMDPATANIHTFDGVRQTARHEGGRKKVKNTHHTTPLAGGAVAGAGQMDIKDGHIRKVTDESGHYRPEGEYTHQAVAQMAKRGLLDRRANRDEVREHKAGRGNLSAKVSLAGYVENDPRQQKGWLKDEDPSLYKGELSLPYQAFLQTQGNERQARAKVSMLEELKDKRARTPKHKPGSDGPASGVAPAPAPGYPELDDETMAALETEMAGEAAPATQPDVHYTPQQGSGLLYNEFNPDAAFGDDSLFEGDDVSEDEDLDLLDDEDDWSDEEDDLSDDEEDGVAATGVTAYTYNPATGNRYIL